MSLPEPPRIRRRVTRPLAVLLGLLALSALPLAAAAGVFESEARASSLHVLIAYAALLCAFRLLGKRELGRLSPFELVTLMLIPEVLSGALQGQGSLISGLAGLGTLLALVLATSLLAHRSERFETMVESPPTILVHEGRLLESRMNDERILPDELFSEMRKQGFEELSQVKWAVLESSGNITFVPWREHATPRTEDDPTH